MIIDEAFLYLWEWFFDLSSGFGRLANGVCSPIPWSEMLAWAQVTGNVVRSGEYDILRAVDLAYCAEMNIELQDAHARHKDEIKNKASKPRRK